MIADLAFSALLGFLGFIQPCSFGVNSIFLSYMKREKISRRLLEVGKMFAVRVAFFSLLGAAAGYAVDALWAQMPAYPYLILGSIFLISKIKPLPMPNVTPLKLLRRANDPSLPLAVNFGLSIPSCVLPLLIAALLLAQNAAFGIANLFLFSLALSLPLILAAWKNKGMEKVSELVDRAPVIAGASLIAFALKSLEEAARL